MDYNATKQHHKRNHTRKYYHHKPYIVTKICIWLFHDNSAFRFNSLPLSRITKPICLHAYIIRFRQSLNHPCLRDSNRKLSLSKSQIISSSHRLKSQIPKGDMIVLFLFSEMAVIYQPILSPNSTSTNYWLESQSPAYIFILIYK